MNNHSDSLPILVRKVWDEYTEDLITEFGQTCLNNHTNLLSGKYVNYLHSIEVLGIVLLAVSDVKEGNKPSSDNRLYQQSYAIAQELNLCS